MAQKTAAGRGRPPINPTTYLPPQGDTIPSETLVVQYGYVPLKAQIERMIQAGKELDAYRKEYYDFEDERQIPKDFVDPTRDPNFDPCEAYAYMRVLAKRVKAREEELKRSKTISTPTAPEPDPARKDDKVVDKQSTK